MPVVASNMAAASHWSKSPIARIRRYVFSLTCNLRGMYGQLFRNGGIKDAEGVIPMNKNSVP